MITGGGGTDVLILTVIFSVGKAGVGGGEEKLEGIKVREGYF